MNRRSVLGSIAAGLVGLLLGSVRNSGIPQAEVDKARLAHGKCDLCHTLPNYVVKYHSPALGVTEYSFQHFPEWEPKKAWPLPVWPLPVSQTQKLTLVRAGLALEEAITVNWYPLDCIAVI